VVESKRSVNPARSHHGPTGLRRRTRLGLTGMLAMIVLVAGAGSTSASSQKDSSLSTDWRLAYTDSIDYQANVFASFNATPYFIFTEVYDLLLNYNLATGAPDIHNSPAYKYQLTDNGKTITYWLHKGMRWSDGKPFTSADVVFSYRVAHLSNVNSTYTANIKSVKALGPYEFQIKMKRYDARILSAFVPIVPKHIWAPHAHNAHDLTHFNPCCPMVGSGPFYVKSIDPNGTSVLLPNPYFYGHKGHIQRILLIKYQDEDSALRDLELGQLDAINGGSTRWEVPLRKEPNVKLWASPGPGFDEIAMNSCPIHGSPTCTGPAPSVDTFVVQNTAIRQALNWAIDREAINRDVYNSLSAPGTGIISTYYKAAGYFKSYADNPVIGYHYDPDKAAQILKAGGWQCPPMNSGGVCTKDGHKAEFTLDLRSDDSQQQSVGLRVQAWAAAIGIKINLQIMTDDAINAQIYASTSSKRPGDSGKYEPSYDSFMWGWGGDVSTPDYDFEVLACGDASSDSFWCNRRYTRLTKEALTQPDFKKRVDLLHQAEAMELRASPYIITQFTPYLSVTRTDTWTNYQPSPGAGGQPFGWSWIQLQLLQPGKKASTNYAGTAYVIAFMVGTLMLVLGVGFWRRHREEHQPFELPPAAAPEASGE
jgi:peptide/nickel transport system substrate-binding protein